MPTYEYACSACGHQWEEIQKISEPALEACPKCTEKTAKRLISGGSFILKGGGWYADLYSSKPSKPASTGESAAPTKAETPAGAPAAAPAPSTTAPSTASTGGGDSGSSSSGSSST